MARPRKESHPITVRMEQRLYEKLEEFCNRSGQPKTVAIERALASYIDNYNKKEEAYAKLKDQV